MNILLINHYAGSPNMGMEFRPYYFAREWVKMGHRVDIIAADYSHLRRKNPQVERDFQSEVIDGINYYWIKTNKYDGNGVKRFGTMAKFVSKLWRKAKWIASSLEPDIIICSSTYPLDTYVGQRIKKKSSKTVKLIHEVHDMWPLSPIEIGGMSPKHPFIRIMQIGENSFCKNSDIVVSLLPAAQEYFVEHGMPKEHFRYVPNGIVLEEWENYAQIPENISNHFKRAKQDGKFNLCFFGSLHKTYQLELLIEAIKQMDNDNLMLTLIGPGMDRKELEERATGYEEKIKFFDPIIKTAIPDLFNYIDAIFIGLKNQKLARFGICMNKLFDAMMGAKPIIYMVNAPNNYIKEYNCGINIEDQSTEGIMEAIKQLMSKSYEEQNLMGKNGRKAAMEKFNYTALAKYFISIMEE